MPGATFLDLALKLIGQIGLPAATGFIGLLAWMWERKQNITLAEQHAVALGQLREQNAMMQAKVMDLAVAQIQVITRLELEIGQIITALNTKPGKARGGGQT